MNLKTRIALNSAKNPNRGTAKECDLEVYNQLIREPWLAEMVNSIREGQESLKDQLPFRCSHYYRFKDNHRAQADMDPESFLFQTCVDIDDTTIVEQCISHARELDMVEGTWKDHLLHMEYSARKKLHIDIRMPKGMTIEETQQAYCKALGVDYDGSCVSPERFILITDASQTIYTSRHWYEVLPAEELQERREAFLKRGLTIDGRQPHNTAKGAQSARQKAQQQQSPAKNTAQQPTIDHSKVEKADARCLKVFDLCMEKAGLTERSLQIKGARHNSLVSIFSMGACRLMTKEQMRAVVKTRMHDYADEQDCQRLIDDFYAKYTETNRPMTHQLIEIHAETCSEKDPDDQSEQADEPQELPESKQKKRQLNAKLLPPGLREAVAAAPKNMQMNVLCAMMPIAATYADQVEVVYADGKPQKLVIMCLIIGRQASGKSYCKDGVMAWMKVLRDEATQYRALEDAVKEKNKLRKANERAEEMPKNPIQIVSPTISNSALLKRFKNAPGHALFSFCEELDTLIKSNTAGNWSAKYDIYRLGFDHGLWGQDYVSDQAESGEVEAAYDFLMFGTYSSLYRCFAGDNAENGLGGRILLSEMPDMRFSQMPQYRLLNDKEKESIEKAAALLRSKKGRIEVPILCKRIGQWLEEMRLKALKNMDDTIDEFRKRAAVIAFRCGVIFHLLSGKEKESRACVDFMLMMADYVLDNQLNLLGETLHNQQGKREPKAITIHDKTTFDRLPELFNMDNVKVAKGAGFEESTYRAAISHWVKEGLIEVVPKEELGGDTRKHWRKIVKNNPLIAA